MDLGLGGRACAITGGSRGIGLETARQLCAEGASVLLIARNQDELGVAAQRCRDASQGEARVSTLALDVTAADAAERILGAASDELGQLDVLVNGAGVSRWRDLEHVPDDDWYAAWELNVMAPMRLMKAAAPAMAERGWGRIVNVSSSAGKRPSQMMAEYSVAKAAQLSLSRLFADRLVGDGVLVNAVCPGATKSEMWMADGGLLDQYAATQGIDDRDRALAAADARRSAGRMAEVHEVAAAIVFLASDRASYISGAALSVDGGTVQVII